MTLGVALRCILHVFLGHAGSTKVLGLNAFMQELRILQSSMTPRAFYTGTKAAEMCSPYMAVTKRK